MLKQPVFVTILTTTQTPDGQKDSMELNTEGFFTVNGKKVVLRYDVYEEDGKKTSSVYFDGEQTATLQSDGQMQYRLKLRKDRTTDNRIRSFGHEMDLQVFTTQLSFHCGEKNGRIFLEYDFISDDQTLTANQVQIKITPKRSLDPF